MEHPLMALWWRTCDTCGDSFPSTNPAATDCGDKNKHARIAQKDKRRKDKK
jgi:hypothetical protein